MHCILPDCYGKKHGYARFSAQELLAFVALTTHESWTNQRNPIVSVCSLSSLLKEWVSANTYTLNCQFRSAIFRGGCHCL